MISGGLVDTPRPSSRKDADESSDPEKSPAGDKGFPKRFKELLPTMEPLPSLSLLEQALRMRVSNREGEES